MKSDADIQAEAAKTRKTARGRKGRGASILTSDTNFLNFLAADQMSKLLQPSEEGGRATLG